MAQGFPLGMSFSGTRCTDQVFCPQIWRVGIQDRVVLNETETTTRRVQYASTQRSTGQPIPAVGSGPTSVGWQSTTVG